MGAWQSRAVFGIALGYQTRSHVRWAL